MKKLIHIGGIPFSRFLKKKKKSLRKKSKRISNKKSKRISNKKSKKILTKHFFINKNKKYCKCNNKNKNNRSSDAKNKNSPEGLGYCSNCIPTKIIMKGKDGNLWENKNPKGQKKKWIQLKL